MNFDFNKTMDSFSDGIKEVAEVAHNETCDFHENYVSKVIPECGKYGDAAKFVAEMVPGVTEYNAIKDGDWQAFAIAAGLDIAAIAVGAFTAGAGYAAVKGGTTAAKAGVKVAVKEVAEAGVKKAVKETAEAGVKKAVKETAEAGAEKVVKETTEEAVEKGTKELTEEGIEHIAYYTDDIERINQTPKSGFDGVRGDSNCYPDVNTDAGQKAADKLAEYGQDSIKYEKGVVDFSPVSETTVQIDMTNNRKINFENADDACSKKWNDVMKDGKSDWSASDVKEWRKENNFTWHERSDMKRCDLVSRDIHTSEVFSHSGGIAEFNARNKVDLGGLFDE